MAGTSDDWGTPVRDIPEDVKPLIEKFIDGGSMADAIAEYNQVLEKRNEHLLEKPERQSPALRIVK